MSHPATRVSSRPATPESLRAAAPALAGLSAVFLFEMMSNTVLNVALPTIGRELGASTAALPWVTNAYAVVFGGLMLLFGVLADRWGRRRVMLVGLALLGAASLATVAVTSIGGLIAVRAVMGLAAAMTTPGTMAMAFRLFGTESLRVRAITLISTVGMVGLAVGPTVGGLVLAVAPWQALLLVNVPLVVLAMIGIHHGVPIDDPAGLHRAPIDVPGALLGTVAIILLLLTPTAFVEQGLATLWPWLTALAAGTAAAGFLRRQRRAASPLIDLTLIAHPQVSAGLAYKAAAGLGNAALAYLITLHLQLAWGWPPALASLGMLPQVIVLLAGGPFVSRFVAHVGLDRAAWLSSSAVVAGLAVYTVFGRLGYPFIALALILLAAGLRVVGAAAGVHVLDGLPADRTSTGAALIDTAAEGSGALGVAVVGTVLAAAFTGDLTTGPWTVAQAGQFDLATWISGGLITVIAASAVAWARHRTRLSRATGGDPVRRPVRR